MRTLRAIIAPPTFSRCQLAIHHVVRRLVPFVQNRHSDVVEVAPDRMYVEPLQIARLLRQELRTESHLPIADLAAWSRAPISSFPSPRYTITQSSVASGRYSIGSFLK